MSIVIVRAISIIIVRMIRGTMRLFQILILMLYVRW